jgi:hypothetical protein
MMAKARGSNSGVRAFSARSLKKGEAVTRSPRAWQFAAAHNEIGVDAAQYHDIEFTIARSHQERSIARSELVFWLQSGQRVDDIRVFYDVTETQVQILAIVTKAEAQAWLDEQGTADQDDAESGGARGSQR